MRSFAALAVLLLVAAPYARPAAGQHPSADDVATPAAIVRAAYDALGRAPGEDFQWDRFRSLFLPGAFLIPNTEQTGGALRVFTADEFVKMVDDWYAQHAPIGGASDRGFAEEEIRNEVREYGDVAQVFSTYRKRYWTDREILGRGINSFQLVRSAGRWWIASIVWDEESGAGPIPPQYLP